MMPQTATLGLAKLGYHTCLRPHSSLVAFPKSTGTELPLPWEVLLHLYKTPSDAAGLARPTAQAGAAAWLRGLWVPFCSLSSPQVVVGKQPAGGTLMSFRAPKT